MIVKVYALALAVVGVPVMAPVELFRLSPGGRDDPVARA
jgi:hypothetical protein